MDVQVLNVTTEQDENAAKLVVTVRLFNPFDQPLTVASGDVYAVYSPTLPDGAGRSSNSLPFPVGPRTGADNVTFPLTVPPGEAVDLDLRFPWQGDPYVGFSILDYQYVAVLDGGR